MIYLIDGTEIIGTANTSEGLPNTWVEADMGTDLSKLYLENGEIYHKPDRPSNFHHWDSSKNIWAIAIAHGDSVVVQEDWDGLISDLRGSDIWAKTFQAACNSLAENAAWTLIQNTLTSTRHPSDLEFSIAALRGAMQPDFSKAEIKKLNTLLKNRGFSIVLS
jgi:hypothetical protein